MDKTHQAHDGKPSPQQPAPKPDPSPPAISLDVPVREQKYAQPQPANSAQQDLERRFSMFEGWMICVTILGVIVAGITGVILWRQLRVMSAQLSEMKSGGVDTHNLAVAAAKQADAAITSQRPWLKVTATIAGPLVFDQYGVRIAVKYHIENTGRSVAHRIQLKDGLGAAGSKLPDPFAERLTMCDAVREEQGSKGETLFPGDHLDIVAMRVMQPSRLRDALIVASSEPQARLNSGLPSPVFRDYLVNGEDISKGTIMPEVFGCVDYEFGFASGHHQTGFVYMIYSNGLRMKPSVGIIPQSRLSIDHDPRTGIQTD